MTTIVYKTTNLVNGKIYIGVHRSSSADDDYLGSGPVLRKAIEKYGREAFRRETLFSFGTFEEAYAKEAEIVDETFVSRSDTYNVTVGGRKPPSQRGTKKKPETKALLRGIHGGSTWLHTDEGRTTWVKGGDSETLAIKLTQGWRLGRKPKRLRKPYLGGTPRKGLPGKPISAEARAKMSAEAKKRTGERASKFGTVWVMKTGEKSKQIKKSTLEQHLSEGWVRGRKQ